MSPQFPTIVLRAQSDERLARLAASGNERAFEAIVDRYRQPLLRYATRIIGDSRADDVVQAAFVSAWTKLHDGEDVRELKAWLYRIVHNGSLNAMKRASSRDLPLLVDNPMATGDDSQSEVERREAVREVLGEIASLPEQQRHAFLAVAVDGRRHRDVGLELGVSEGAVRMLIHRARSSVRAAAAAFSPWPLLAWLKGSGGAGAATTTAASAGGTAGGSAGAGLLTGGVLKAGALVAATGVVATAGPPAVRAVDSKLSSGPAASSVAPAAGARTGTFAGTGKAALRSPRLRAGVPAAAPKAVEKQAPKQAAEPAPAPVVAAVPAPAPAATPAPVPVPSAVEERRDAVKLPSSQPRFIQPAVEEDDWILVEEDPPDYSIGERDVPLDGLSEDSGVVVNLPDPEEAPAKPAPAADPAAPQAVAPSADAPAPSAP